MDGCWLEEGWQQWADARRGERWRPVASLPPNPSRPRGRPPPPLLLTPLPVVQKKTKDISATNPKGGGRGWIVVVLCIKMQRMWQCCQTDVWGHGVRRVVIFSFFWLIWGVFRRCFDHMRLTITQPNYLSRTMKDHNAVFLLPSANPRTHTHTHTHSSLGCSTFFRSPQRITRFELFGCFQKIQES